MRNPPPPLFYLSYNHWSPRFDPTFFSVKMMGHEKIANQLPEGINNLGGKQSLPAYYYKITVFREHSKTVILRRFSQFRKLYKDLRSNPPLIAKSGDKGKPIRFPASACSVVVCMQEDQLAENRQELLAEFLEDILRRPGYASHPSVLHFLGLEPNNEVS